MAAKVLAGVLAVALLAALVALRSSRAETERLRLQLEARPRAAAPAPPPPARDPVPQPPAVPAPAPVPPPPPTVPVESAGDLRRRILDPRLPAEQRIGALRALRFSAPHERTGEVLASMAALLEASPDEGHRRELCMALKGVRDPVLREALLGRLRADPSAPVRIEALDALGAMTGDARAREGIERASREDADADVRARAERILSRPR